MERIVSPNEQGESDLASRDSIDVPDAALELLRLLNKFHDKDFFLTIDGKRIKLVDGEPVILELDDES